MSLQSVKMRISSAPKRAAVLTCARHKSTAVAGTNSSMLEAKSRVQTYARSISQTSAKNATPSQSV